MDPFQSSYPNHPRRRTHTEDLNDPVYSAFVHQAQGANELHKYRLSQSSTPFHPDVDDQNWPLKSADSTEREVLGSPAEVDSFMHQHTSRDGLLSRRDSSWNIPSQPPAGQGAHRNSDYLDDLFSHYLNPQRSFSSRRDGAISSRSKGLPNQTIHSNQSSCYNPFTILLLLLTTGISIFTAIYASGTAKKLLTVHFFSESTSRSLLILRVLSEAITVLFWALGLAVMDQLQWSLASRPHGVSLMQFIQLDLGISFWGLLRLLKQSPWKYKSNAFTRCVQPFCHTVNLFTQPLQ
jgi:hypothetical protein